MSHSYNDIDRCDIFNSPILYWMNMATAISYIAITIMMVYLLKASPLLGSLCGGEGVAKQRIIVSQMAFGLSALFGLFIFLCGLTHLVTALLHFSKELYLLTRIHVCVMSLCGIVSIATAITMAHLFKHIESALKSLEITDEGKVTHLENYIVQVVDMFQESIVVLSSDLYILRGNKSTEHFFGKGFIGLNIRYSIHQDDFLRVRDAVLAVSTQYSGQSQVVQYRINRKGSSGEYRWVESTLTRSTGLIAGGEELSMITRDIEERKQAEIIKAQVDAAKALEELNAAKLRYITCTAHDLKTPLQSFSFAMELLRSTPLTEEQREHVRDAEVSIDLMKMTISQAMDISRSLSGSALQPRRSTVDLEELLQRVQIIIKGYSKQVPIYFNVAPAVSRCIITDEEWLWQMMLNLLTNACKYTETGCIKLELSVMGDMLLLEVIDTGIGIKSNADDDYFSMFGQLQKGQSTGTGLGLYGTKLHVDALGGTCGARSNASDKKIARGSTFWCKIPYIPDELISVVNVDTKESSMPTIPCSWQLVSSPRSKRGRNICQNKKKESGLSAIIVDDAVSICKMLTKILENSGFSSVETYYNGSQGLEALKRKQVDVVFSDVQMPVMTGPEMVERFRLFEAEALHSGTRTRRQTIVAVTANAEERCNFDSSGSLFDQVCAKPMTIKKLKDVLDAVARKSISYV